MEGGPCQSLSSGDAPDCEFWYVSFYLQNQSEDVLFLLTEMPVLLSLFHIQELCPF